MKRITAALVATAALALGTAAQAATTVSSVNTDTALDGSFITAFSDANEVAGLDGLFTETLDFTTLAGFLGIRVDTSADMIGGPNDTDLTRVFLTGTGIASPLDITPAAFSTDLDEAYRLSNLPVLAGNYTLTVQGRPAALNSGFTGQLVFRAATSAVPEPGTWAMMLLGMGAVGWALRRNREAGGARRLSLA